jgi:hypothetical protein
VIERAAHFLEELAANEETEAGALRLGCEVGLEESGLILGTDAAAVVMDFEDDARGIILEAAADEDETPAVCGIDGVEDEIEEDLGEVVAHGGDVREIRGELAIEIALAGPLIVAGDGEDVIGDFGECDGAAGGGGGAREIDEVADGAADAGDLTFDEVELFGGVGFGLAAFEHLDDGAECGEGVADLVGDAGGEEAEGGHFFLVDEPRLGGAEFLGAGGDALFEDLGLPFEFGIDGFESCSGGLKDAGECGGGPGGPGEDDHGGEPGSGENRGGIEDAFQDEEAGGVHGAGPPGDVRRVSDGAADEGEEVVPAEGGFEAGIVVAEESDEDGLHGGDEEGPAAEEDITHGVPCGVERGVARAEGEERGDGPGVSEPGPEGDEGVAHEDSEPAEANEDRFGGEVPEEAIGRAWILWLAQIVVSGLIHKGYCRQSRERRLAGSGGVA